jgi:beta-glucanase (GH16 family)
MFFSALRFRSHSSTRLGLSFVVLIAAIGIFSASASAGVANNGIGVTTPRSGATLSDTAVIKAKVSKSIARRTARVEVWVGSDRVATDWSAPYRFKVDTTQLEDGKVQFRVRAVLKKSRTGGASRALTFSQLIAVYIANRKQAQAKKQTTVLPAPTAPTSTPTAPTSTPTEPTTVPGPLPTPPTTVPPTTTPPATSGDPAIADIVSGAAGWRTTFDDEFSGSLLDRTKFNDQRDDWIKGGSPYNGMEGDWYMPANTTVAGGSLVQTIKKQSMNGAAYTTGMVNTNHKFSFQYGYVESRMKVPACDGCWPAFWTLPNTVGWPPEIDIYEFFDSDTDRHAYFSSHWKSTTADQEWTSVFSSNAALTDAWHTYGMMWTPDYIQPYVDGVAGPKLTGKAVPHEAMYLIIQMALGKNYNTPDGANLQTDYLRVYQQ